MLRVSTFVVKVGIRGQREMQAVISHLRSRGYPAMIRSVFRGMFNSVKLPEPKEQLIADMILRARPEMGPLGDLFITDDIIYVLNSIDADRLQTSAIGYETQEQALQKFCTDVEEGIKTKFDGRRTKGMKFDWKPSSLQISRYIRARYLPYEEALEGELEPKATRLKACEPNYTSEDIKAVKLLVNTNVRQFILKLAQVGKMISKDAIDLAKKPDILQRLISLNLMAEEYLLRCKQDQHTICVVPSKGHLTQEPMASLRCSLCERSFSEENLQLIYTLTEKGKRLIDGSLWMSAWITELLKQSGVKKETIKWGLEAPGEELDIMVEDFDSRLFLELKSREFGLGDAYPFSYRVTRYAGKFGIIATTDKVSTEAKKFFQEETHRRRYAPQIRYLEGPNNIQKGIPKIIKEIALSQVRKVVRPFSIQVGFDLWPIVKHWINMKAK